MFAPGVSVCFRWSSSDGVDALAQMVDAIFEQEYPSSYINTTILVERNEDYLDELLQFCSTLGAALVFYDKGEDERFLQDKLLDVMPSNTVMMLNSDSSIDREFILNGIKLLKWEPSVHIEGHHLFLQSTVNKCDPSSCCAVIPTSLPSLMPRVVLAAQSVLEQDMDGWPDVLVAYSFKYLGNDSAGLLSSCMEHKLPLLLHRHKHNVFPPALARNIGARRVADRHVVFLDADMYLHPETFTEAIQLLEQQPCVVYVEPAMMHYCDETSEMFQDMTKETFEKKTAQACSAPGTGAVVFVTQDVLAATHGYDERFIGYGFTDWDFTERLPAAGFQVVNLTKETGIKAMHIPHPSRNGTNPPSKTSERIYSEEKGRNPKRNPDSWGGIPVKEYKP